MKALCALKTHHSPTGGASTELSQLKNTLNFVLSPSLWQNSAFTVPGLHRTRNQHQSLAPGTLLPVATDVMWGGTQDAAHRPQSTTQLTTVPPPHTQMYSPTEEIPAVVLTGCLMRNTGWHLGQKGRTSGRKRISGFLPSMHGDFPIGPGVGFVAASLPHALPKLSNATINHQPQKAEWERTEGADRICRPRGSVRHTVPSLSVQNSVNERVRDVAKGVGGSPACVRAWACSLYRITP